MKMTRPLVLLEPLFEHLEMTKRALGSYVHVEKPTDFNPHSAPALSKRNMGINRNKLY
jgi:hypothetical protein